MDLAIQALKDRRSMAQMALEAADTDLLNCKKSVTAAETRIEHLNKEITEINAAMEKIAA